MDKRLLLVGLMAVMATGCSTVSVTKDPSANDKGIRFYRPKPYLLVTPADPTGRLVNLKLEYLPDFNEEYAAHLHGKKAAVALKDGWNLVAAGAGAAPPPPEPAAPVPVPAPDGKLPSAVVAATNVPMGYYESVYDVFAERKIFKGWRYIGFLPLGGPATGPCAIPGMTPGPNPACAPGCPPTDALYGVVFFNGAMTFRTLGEIAGNQLCPTYVNPAPPVPGPPVQPNTEELRTVPTNEPVEELRPVQPLAPSPTPEGGILETPAIPEPTTPGLGSLETPAPMPLADVQPASYQQPFTNPAPASSLTQEYASQPLDLNALPPLPQ